MAGDHPAILLVGGAPRVPVDAVRHLTVAASGRTAAGLHRRLAARGLVAEALLSVDCRVDLGAVGRYATREDLDRAVARWVGDHPRGTVVLSAAVNDYRVTAVEWDGGSVAVDGTTPVKVPSGREEVVIRLRPAPKLVAALPSWGHRGPLVLCKYEGAATVLAAAETLRRRTGAACVVANSTDWTVQALVAGTGVRCFAGREALLDALAEVVLALVHHR